MSSPSPPEGDSLLAGVTGPGAGDDLVDNEPESSGVIAVKPPKPDPGPGATSNKLTEDPCGPRNEPVPIRDRSSSETGETILKQDDKLNEPTTTGPSEPCTDGVAQGVSTGPPGKNEVDVEGDTVTRDTPIDELSTGNTDIISVSIHCEVPPSDDELSVDDWKNGWQPTVSEIIELYTEIGQKGVLELNWKSPGRRELVPSNDITSSETDPCDETPDATSNKSNDEKSIVPIEYAFDEFEDSISTTITPKRPTGSTNKNKPSLKRIGRLDKAVSDMMRHSKMDADLQKSDVSPDEMSGRISDDNIV